MAEWVATGLTAPPGFTPHACRVHTREVSYCAGWCEPYQNPTAVLFRLEPAGVRELVRRPGRFLALDVADEVVWALLSVARPEGGSSFSVLRSPALDQPLPVPATSLARLLAVSATEAWVLGPDTLLRTTDGGQTWQAVSAPGQRSGVTERLEQAGSTVRLLTQGSVLTTRDGGANWQALDLQGARACALDKGALLAVQNGEIRFGAPSDAGVQWLGSFAYDAEPVRLAMGPGGASFAALPNHPEQQPGILYFESADQGQNWGIQLIPARVIEGAVDLRAEGGLMVGPAGDLFILRG